MKKMTRKDFLGAGATLFLAPELGRYEGKAVAYTNAESHQELPRWIFPDLAETLPGAVIVKSVELLKVHGELMLVVTSADGTRGITQCNDRMIHLVSLLKGLVIPHFVGKDARSLPELVDNAYRLNSNYKYAGMPLWNCIGSVEIAIWDLLGRIAEKPTRELLGRTLRSEYGVYISDWNRDGDPEKIADQLLMKLELTGSTGVKIKVGGRMTNTPENTAHTRKFVPVLRKKLGEKVVIYADANGSYTPSEGIETGRFLEGYGVEIFEEPCNFENEEGLLKVTRSLRRIKVAGGEQDTSVYRFKRLAEHNVYNILQPDVYYCGGILRTLQVSEIARKFGGKGFAPHSPKADPLIGPFWQVAALVPNLYGLQECVFNPQQPQPGWHSRIEIRNGKVEIPNRPGLGVEYDGTIWKGAEKLV